MTRTYSGFTLNSGLYSHGRGSEMLPLIHSESETLKISALVVTKHSLAKPSSRNPKSLLVLASRVFFIL